MTTVAESIVTALADVGVTRVWGVVGDALNPVTDAIRRDDRVERVGVRHGEAAAFAVSAQSQLSGPAGSAWAPSGPVLLDVVTNPDEVAIPPKPTLAQGWVFASAKSKRSSRAPDALDLTACSTPTCPR